MLRSGCQTIVVRCSPLELRELFCVQWLRDGCIEERAANSWLETIGPATAMCVGRRALLKWWVLDVCTMKRMWVKSSVVTIVG
jgi:hypothetical protein